MPRDQILSMISLLFWLFLSAGAKNTFHIFKRLHFNWFLKYLSIPLNIIPWPKKSALFTN
jgi:hypothetical protein